MAPQFQPGGGVESTKVWTKRNKRDRGMVSNGKEPNHIGNLVHSPMSSGSKPRQPSLNLERQGQLLKITDNKSTMVMNTSNPQSQMIRHRRRPVVNLLLVTMMRWWWRLRYRTNENAQDIHQIPPSLLMMNAFKDFSVLAWNVRGFSIRKSRSHMHELVSRYKPDMLVILETHTVFSSAETFWNRVNYEMIDVQEVQGHYGGIWVMQRKGSDFNFTPVSKMHQGLC
ncbi:hypothetical protein TSUD_62590 [Trifolium subterraneum]|uniref:Endonuclease/exonuclease/phosphatase domain-containing protein n=1 Tax=Trifolium subterraneum TaxID=3900 RepID=A0A2Z6NG07_TRISU|nr:hypothetical protein TSUD_62590 [Trifolium subterraneum]